MIDKEREKDDAEERIPYRRGNTIFSPGPVHRRRLVFAIAAVLIAVLSGGCTLAINRAGKTLVSGNSVYATDDDPDLVWEAMPFGLKTLEGLLAKAPKSKPLLLAVASGFTQYGYGHLQQDADFVEVNDLAAATALRVRARKMYRRALEYGLRGIEVDVPNFRVQLQKNPQTAVNELRETHVPLLYWTANAWGAAISISKDDPALAADQNLVEALMRRALALDETWERGSIHDFFISYEGGRVSIGGSLAKAREHFERAKQLSQGTRLAPLVTYAETVCVSTQSKKEFQSLLEEVLAFDANRVPEMRVANLVSQRRATWLLSRVADLFVD